MGDLLEGSLTKRQAAVLRLLCRGYSNDEIGRACGVTEATAKAHVSSLLRKFGVTNRTELVARAVGLGLVDVFAGDSVLKSDDS